MMAKDKTKKEKLVTVIGSNYIHHLILNLLSNSFEVYKKRDFTMKSFQVSVLENTYATAGIVLTVLGIEAYRNRIFYLEKKKVEKDVANDLSNIIGKKEPTFPKDNFRNILREVFVIRDVIVHNHIYEVEVSTDENWEMLGHKQKLLEGYGDNEKFKNSVNSRTRKTKLLKFNVQPAKIGFEDLNTLLVAFDLFVGISQNIFGYGHVPFHFAYKLNNNYEDNLSRLLASYCERIPNQKYINQVNILIKKNLKNDYSKFLANNREYVITNICPKCSAFVLHKPNNITSCSKCKFEIKIASNIPIPVN